MTNASEMGCKRVVVLQIGLVNEKCIRIGVDFLMLFACFRYVLLMKR